ncbi:hypothetical protein [Cellulosimicrobium cellulans]|uniref:hypothetical protein n=1 Tax=Cellulosimicrobium cellulans TaxID=1710 RepID=UPI001BA88CF2|nr:hypothetical protein [Cellulosimicrobium cellulans]QUC01207.1 hypothetical protein J5A69_08615 [Cellulosimicrobium cellulans]
MGKKPKLLRSWYGPDAYEAQDAAMMGTRRTVLNSGVISVTDVQEAINLAAGVYSAETQIAPTGSEIVIRSNSSTGTTRYGANAADLAAAEWDNTGFEIGFATPVRGASNAWNSYTFHDVLTLSFSTSGVSVMSARPTGLPGSTTAPEALSPRAHDAALKALLAGLERRTPPIRKAQMRALILPAAMVALWLWAMLVWQPPLPVWLFTGALTALAAHAAFKGVDIPSIARIDRIGEQPWGTPLVDLTPRAEVLARRASGHRDAKVAAVTVATTLAAAVITAYFTGLWTPGAGG